MSQRAQAREIVVETAGLGELPAIRALLTASHLPTAGLGDQPTTVLAARHGGRIVGTAALERYDDCALLRSVAVAEPVRGLGLGVRLSEAAVAFARSAGVRTVYLLTETAAEFFSRFGFRRIARDAVAPAVQRSAEFTEACRASAVVMCLHLISAVIIRAAEPADAPTIALVLRAAFAEYALRYTPLAYAATTPSSEDIERRLSEGPAWVALLDDVVVGTVSALPRRKALHIRSLAVVPAARGRGVGSMLLRCVEGYAAKHGYARLVLSTTPFLAEAIRLYEWSGFRRSEEGAPDLFGTHLFTMTKPLEP